MHKVLSTIAVATGLTGAAFLGGVAVSSLASAQDDAPPTTEPPAEATPETTPEERPVGAREGCRGPGRGAGMEAAAEALGMTTEELRTALRDGQTIAEIAEANGVDVQVVIDAMVAEAQEHLAEKVAAGEMTQEEADEKLANLEERITERVNSDEPPRFGPGRPGGPRGELPAEEPEVEGSSFSTETASLFAA
jgi:hypothetical protein